MATTNDLKNGIVLKLDGQLWTVTDFQHVKPGKGGAFVRTTLKNVLSGKVVDKTFNAGLKVETATVDKRNMTFLSAFLSAFLGRLYWCLSSDAACYRSRERAVSRSSGVSTPSGTVSTIVTSMRMPASSARSCSSLSRCSSGEGGSFTNRSSAARR